MQFGVKRVLRLRDTIAKCIPAQRRPDLAKDILRVHLA